MINREAIYSVLFVLLQNCAPFKTASRRLVHWTDVDGTQQPALFLAQGAQISTQETRQPTKWLLKAEIYVYARTDGGAAPGPLLNQLLDAIEAALAPSFPNVNPVQTLGGLVDKVWIDGAIETDEGTLGDQAVAIIPVSILAS